MSCQPPAHPSFPNCIIAISFFGYKNLKYELISNNSITSIGNGITKVLPIEFQTTTVLIIKSFSSISATRCHFWDVFSMTSIPCAIISNNSQALRIYKKNCSLYFICFYSTIDVVNDAHRIQYNLQYFLIFIIEIKIISTIPYNIFHSFFHDLLAP